MSLQDEVRSVVEREGVIARRDHLRLANAMAWLVRRGELTPVLPGIFCPREAAATFEARVAALARWDPDAVLMGSTAGRLTFWPGRPRPRSSARSVGTAPHRWDSRPSISTTSLHEDDPEVFENDRWRQNALVLEGWVVLRFTWRMLEDHPGLVIAAIQEKVVRAARRFLFAPGPYPMACPKGQPPVRLRRSRRPAPGGSVVGED